MIGGAVLLTLIPFIAQPFFEVAISALDEIEAGAFVGSLFAVLILVAIPLAVLGTVSPWAIRLSVDEVENAGAVAGRLYAISTVGLAPRHDDLGAGPDPVRRARSGPSSPSA